MRICRRRGVSCVDETDQVAERTGTIDRITPDEIVSAAINVALTEGCPCGFWFPFSHVANPIH
jgi:hypothetical protein